MESRKAMLAVAQCIVLRYALGDFEFSSLVINIMSKNGPHYFVEQCCKWMLTQINAMVHERGYRRGRVVSPDMWPPSGSRGVTPEDVRDLERSEYSEYFTSTSGSSFSGNSREQSVEIISVHPLQQEHILPKDPSARFESATQSSNTASGEEIINFKPTNQKPNFKFEPSPLSGSLPSFLDALRSANEQLVLGAPCDQKIELSDSDEGEHIEIDLGLGVLEHVNPGNSSPEPQILGLKRKASTDGFDSLLTKAATPPEKKPRIDELPSPFPRVTVNLIHTMTEKLNASTASSSSKALPGKKTQKGIQASKAKSKSNGRTIKFGVSFRLTIDHQAGDATVEVDDIVTQAQWSEFEQQLDGDMAELETYVKDMNAVQKSMWEAFEGGELDGSEIVHILDE
ncbi:hypothetical protein BJ875DRAFT_254063 [Amylocarpus encephaloides]|uniref:Uncharacterized protein n=1 Tax=Amylocarpus encephaloides TaxID=45428 RepID=A0A9P7YMR5_9HELO|nr:hypothetical protein BJ875DRAFT_254063 [Amylocarpus encephaloides]